MIAFAKPYEPDKDKLRELAGYLRAFGDISGVNHKKRYRNFCNQAIEIAPRFLQREVSLDAVLMDCDEIAERMIAVMADFPSGAMFPFIAYHLHNHRFDFQEEPTSAYSLVVNGIRRGRLNNDHEINFAYNILGLNGCGIIEGQEVLNDADVDFVKRLLGEFVRK